MSAEIPARQAREILDNRKEWNLDLWYLKWKDKFFEGVKEAALNGYDSIKITPEEWGRFESAEKYLKDRLTALGYSVKITDTYMVVSW